MTSGVKSRTPTAGGAEPAETGAEIASSTVLLIFKFVSEHLTAADRELLKDLKPGEYISVERVLPSWEALTERCRRSRG
jgi:hypothetical protein